MNFRINRFFLLGLCCLMLASCKAPDFTKLPLSNAVMSGNTAQVKTLLASGVKVDAADDNGVQAIHWASQNSNSKILTALIEAGAKVDAQDNKGNQPIIYAVEMHNLPAVNTLLQAGAKIDVVDQKGLQPIHLSAYSDDIEMTKALITAGANVNALDRNGDQALHWAARYGNAEIAKALLNAGAKIDAKDHNGEQALHWAARYGNYGNADMMNVLLGAGAKADEPNNAGQSPNEIAKHIGSLETDKDNLKGNLDEATLNFIRYTLTPIFIRAKLCAVWNGSDGCIGKDIILCSQGNALSCDIYGIADQTVIKEVAHSFQNSGLRIKKVSFWSNPNRLKSLTDKPIYEFN